MATSTLAGIGPAALKVWINVVRDSWVPLHFQFPPMRYARSPAAAGSPVEDPFGLPLLWMCTWMWTWVRMWMWTWVRIWMPRANENE
jgi:hypothetical protein